MRQSLISIIVPVYNATRHLSKMLDSVVSQSYSNWEMILINDGSTDDSETIIQSYENQDNRFRYFKQSNAGPSVARNLGINEAKGYYLAFIDADDWVSPDYLAKLIQPMLTTDADLVCAGYYEVNPQFPKGLKLHDFPSQNFNQNIEKKTYQFNLFNGVSGVLWAKLFKKEIFLENGIQLHPQLRFSEDLVAVLEYSRFTGNAFIVPDTIYYYNRVDDGGLSGRLNLEKYTSLKIFFEEIEKFKEDLSFLDLDAIKNKRKYSFMIQLLRDHAYSKREFYKVADFLLENESPLNPAIFQNHILNDFILKGIFNRLYFRSWFLFKLLIHTKIIKRIFLRK